MTTRTLFVIHKWTGLVSGLLLFVVCLSGAVAVFKAEIDWLITPAKRVKAQEIPASIDAVLRAAGPNVSGVVFPSEPDVAYTAYAGKRHVFIDPYTAKVTGWREGETVANVIRQLHARFYFFGWQGRVFVGVLGLTLTISAITGLVIYAPFMRGVWAQGLRWWQIRKGWQLAWSDWHKLIGITSIAFNLLLGVTGAVLGLENLTRYTPRLDQAVHPRPQAKSAPREMQMIGGDAAIAAAKRAMPDLVPTSLLLPSKFSGHYTIYGNITGHFAREAANFICIDAYDGSVLQVHDSRLVSTGVRAYDWAEPLHFGRFGKTIMTLYVLLGLAGSFLSVSGFVLWLIKRRSKSRSLLIGSRTGHLAAPVHYS